MTYNWKGQGYESIEAFRSHLIYFEWSLVEEYLKSGTTGSKPADEALALRPLPGTQPKVSKNKPQTTKV